MFIQNLLKFYSLCFVASLSVPATYAQVELVADIWPGTSSSDPFDLVVFGDKLYFWAENDQVGLGLFATDGSTTDLVAEIRPDLQDYPILGKRPLLGELDNKLYFRLRTPPFTESVYQIWSTDGFNTQFLSNIHTGDSWRSTAVLDNKMFFEGDDGSAGEELYYIENDVVNLFKDIRPSPESSRPRCFTRVKDWVFFTAIDESDTRTVWVTDGDDVWNVSGPRAWCTRPHEMIEYKDELYYAGFDAAHGLEVWKSDGISTSLVHDINIGPDGSLAKNWFKGFGLLFFVADDGVHGWELWAWDGTYLRLAIDLNPGPGSGFEHMTQGHQIEAAVYDGQLYFVGDDGASGLAMWSWVGGAPQQVTNACTTCYKQHPFYLTTSGDMFIFRNYDSNYGEEPWLLQNGTAAPLADIRPGPLDSSPSHFTEFRDAIYFTAFDPDHGRELWRYTATSTGTETSPELPGKPRIVNALTAYPNPFATTTNISFELTRPSDVRLEVFDLLGKRVRLLESGFKPSGEHEVTFDATGLSTGIYFYTLTAGGFTKTRKMVVVK